MLYFYSDSWYRTILLIPPMYIIVSSDTDFIYLLCIYFQTVGNKITPLVVNPGRIVLTNVTLYFQPYNNAEPVPVFKVKLASIKRIFQRR